MSHEGGFFFSRIRASESYHSALGEARKYQELLWSGARGARHRFYKCEISTHLPASWIDFFRRFARVQFSFACCRPLVFTQAPECALVYQPSASAQRAYPDYNSGLTYDRVALKLQQDITDRYCLAREPIKWGGRCDSSRQSRICVIKKCSANRKRESFSLMCCATVAQRLEQGFQGWESASIGGILGCRLTYHLSQGFGVVCLRNELLISHII